MRPPSSHLARRGAIAPLTAVVLIVFVGMVAFAVDMAWIVTAEGELQNAADAAALAGTDPLMEGMLLYQLPNQKNRTAILADALNKARTSAKQFAAHNAAGDVRSLTLRDEDIEFGFTNAQGNYTPIPTWTGFPNTIKVLLRRDRTANGSLKLFFGPALGVGTADLTATASATLYAGRVNTFQQNPPPSIYVLPMTLDVNDWNTFLQTGKSPNNKTLEDDNNNPQLQVYPLDHDKGNFGELGLDGSHAGSGEIRDWISRGINTMDLQALFGANLLPLSTHDPNRWDWIGNPGMRTSTIQAVNDLPGKVYYLPLFRPMNDNGGNYSPGIFDDSNYDPGTGEGSHYYYNIVDFVGVRIMPANGNHKIFIQPAPVSHPNAILNPASIAPAGTTSQIITTFAPARLTR